MLRTTSHCKPIPLQTWAKISYFIWLAAMHACFAWTQAQQYSLIFSMLWLLPMWLPMRGVLQGKKYTFQWACYLICLYISHGLTLAMVSERFQAIGVLETCISLILFALFVARARYGALLGATAQA